MRLAHEGSVGLLALESVDNVGADFAEGCWQGDAAQEVRFDIGRDWARGVAEVCPQRGIAWSGAVVLLAVVVA